MKRMVLIPFDYALDGVRVNRLRAGRPAEIRAEHIARFEEEGKIERATAPTGTAANTDAVWFGGAVADWGTISRNSSIARKPSVRRSTKGKTGAK